MKFKRTLNDKRAFTLPEVAVVLVVLGIIIAMTIPSFSRFIASNRLEGATNQLVADIHYARSLAVAKRKTYQIVFEANRYRVIDQASGAVVRTRNIPPQLACAASANPRFFAWGLADPVNINISQNSGPQANALTLLANGSVQHN